ncbi:hypothetical protein ACTXT7_003572 [Hymenolepis weldensis]
MKRRAVIPPRGREDSIVSTLLTHSEHLSSSEDDKWKSWELNARHFAKHLQVSEGIVRNVVHQDHGYKSYVLRQNRQFMWTKTTQENRLIRAKRLVNKVKHPEEQKGLWFFSDKKTSTRIKGMIGGYLRTDPTEIPTSVCTKFPPIMMISGVVSIEGHYDSSIFFHGADAYAKILQTIVVKPLWIDNVANGGRPFVFQQDSALL